MDSRKVISLQIDVTKINKSRLYAGKKGKYLNAVLFLNEEADQYGNHGFISESVSKEEREAGTRGNILGNAKDLSRNESLPDVNDDSDLPF